MFASLVQYCCEQSMKFETLFNTCRSQMAVSYCMNSQSLSSTLTMAREHNVLWRRHWKGTLTYLHSLMVSSNCVSLSTVFVLDAALFGTSEACLNVTLSIIYLSVFK